jgi:uncharacterized phiE125 gp8 family phage protein
MTVDEAKVYLRVAGSADDALIQLLLEAATEYAESYTRRELRANTWTLSLDEFGDEDCGDRISIRRDPVASVTSVTRLVLDVATVFASSNYYLKRLQQRSQIVLVDGADWPDDTDDREQAIVVTFVTAPHRALEQIKVGILRHLAYLYENRGDCGDCSSDVVRATSAHASGAAALYDQHRVARV